MLGCSVWLSIFRSAFPTCHPEAIRRGSLKDRLFVSRKLRGRWPPQPRLANEWIDFVDDPIICQNNCKQSPHEPQRPTLAPPSRAKWRLLHGNVDEVCSAVAKIRDQREDH